MTADCRLPRICVALLSWLLICFETDLSAADKTTGSTRNQAIRSLADMIDEHLCAKLSAEQVQPAEPADDAEFHRRVWLQLAGTIPPVSDVRRFLADASPDKRERLVQELLSRPSFVRNMTTFWRKAWLPEAETDVMVQARVPAVEVWLRQQLVNELRYDEIVKQLLSVPLSSRSAANASRVNDAENGPIAFLLAKEAKPESLAASTSRAFLGVRLDCAQCHDHPFDRWKRDQFWSFAAFFAGLERGDGNQPTQAGLLKETADRREIMMPETDRLVSAVFLDGTEPKWRSRGGRQVLAEWITSPKNPYFAKAAVNRLWGHVFGVGLVDPVDDFSSANAASHPELLDALATAFVAQDYDVKFLLRAMLGSESYQRTSRPAQPEVPLNLFGHLPVQGMSAEQMVRSLREVLGTDAQIPAAVGQPFFPQPDELTTLFARPGESPTHRQTTILQALTLMNGRLTAEATDVQRGALLAAAADFPGLSAAERIEILYLGTVSRFPKAGEAERCVNYVTGSANPRTALGDVLWALLNSVEFASVH